MVLIPVSVCTIIALSTHKRIDSDCYGVLKAKRAAAPQRTQRRGKGHIDKPPLPVAEHWLFDSFDSRGCGDVYQELCPGPLSCATLRHQPAIITCLLLCPTYCGTPGLYVISRSRRWDLHDIIRGTPCTETDRPCT